MTGEALLISISSISPELVEENRHFTRRSVNWFLPVAACVALLVGFFLIPDGNLPPVIPPAPIETGGVQNSPPAGLRVEVLSLQELAALREDEFKTDGSMTGGQALLSAVDRVSYLSLLEGKITWICYFQDPSTDTGENTEVLYITTEGADGSWTRTEYVFSQDQPPVFDELSKLEPGASLPMEAADGRIIVFGEERRPHPSLPGEYISWQLLVDGILVNQFYYAPPGLTPATWEIFSQAKLVAFP